ncbi:MAG TPA: terminase family protein [Patescibacteria group bacterium]|nr:terminase family protein [Patescibacteria group bacterium]
METEHIIIPYTPLPYQQALHDDPHRFKVIAAGRRVGKTTFATNHLIKLAFQRNLPINYWYLAPFEYQARTIAWQMFLKYTPPVLWRKKPTESNMTIYLINGAQIALRGCDNPLGLEGIALGGLIIDEVSAIAHFKSLWEYTLRPMLTDYSSPAIFISKPRGFNHFHELAKLGDHQHLIEGELPSGMPLNNDYATYRLETEMNCREHHGGYLPHKEIEDAKNQLSPEAFDQEYRARFVAYSGLVHKAFSRDVHIIPDMEIPLSWERIRGFDFGSANPTASVRIAIDTDGNWFIEYCYKVRDKSINDHAAYIIAEDSDMKTPIPTYGDPSGRQWMTELNNKGLNIHPAKRQKNTTGDNWLQLSIDLINTKLQPKEGHVVYFPNGTKRENAPSFFILNRPENFQLVDEFESLAYKEQNGINIATIEDTRDAHGHYDLHAALRYAIVSQGYQTSFQIIPTGPTPQERLSKDEEIKAMLRDPNKLKEFEKQADQELIKQQNAARRW